MNSANLPAPVLVILDGNNLSYSVAKYDAVDPNHRHDCLLAMLRGVSRLLGLDGLMAPGRVVCVWDSGLAPWRKAIFPGYKAQRAERTASESAEDALRRDQRYIDIKAFRYSLLPWLGVDQMYCGGPAEGDDLILLAINQLVAAEHYKSVLIVSGDGDLDQLITPQREPRLDSPVPDVGIYRVAPGDLYKAYQHVTCRTGADVVAKHGVWPEDYVGVKAIIGDHSDKDRKSVV